MPSPDTTPRDEGGMAAARRLSRIAEALEAGTVPDSEDGAWMAGALQRYLQDACSGMTIEAALGLRVSPGGSPWWAEEQRASRDAAIRELANTFSGRVSNRAHAAAEAIRHYQGVAWRRDCQYGVQHSTDARRAILFKIFSVGIDVPTSVRQLIKIIDI